MKFGRRLIEESRPDWAHQYINYKELKKAIKVITGTETSSFTISQVTSNFGNIPALAGNSYRPPESRFQDLLNFEVKKINCFACLQYSGLMTRLPSMIRSLRRDGIADLDAMAAARQKCEAASCDAADLHGYIRLNFLGFRKITKKYDKHNQSRSSAFYLAHLLKEPFFNLNLELLLLLVNLCCAELRRAERKLLGINSAVDGYEEIDADTPPLDVNAAAAQPGAEPQTTAAPPSPLTATKYFVVPDHDSMRLRLLLAKHMPLALPSAAVKPLACRLLQQAQEQAGVDALQAKLQSDEAMSLETLMTLVTTHGVGPAGLDSRGLCVNPGFYNSPENRPAVGLAYLDTPELKAYMALVKLQRGGVAAGTDEIPHLLRLRWSCPVDLDRQNSVPVILERVDGRGFADDTGEWADVDHQKGVSPEQARNSVCLLVGQLPQLFDPAVAAADIASKAIVRDGYAAQAVSFLESVLPDLRSQMPTFIYWCHRTNFRRVGPKVKLSAYAHIDEAISFSPVPVAKDFGSLLTQAILSPPRFPLADQPVTGCPNAIVSVTLADWSTPTAGEFLRELTASDEVAEITHYSSVLHAVGVLRESELPKRGLPLWLPSVQSFEEEVAGGGTSRPTAAAGQMQNQQRVDATMPKPADRLLHDRVDANSSPPDDDFRGIMRPGAVGMAPGGMAAAHHHPSSLTGEQLPTSARATPFAVPAGFPAAPPAAGGLHCSARTPLLGPADQRDSDSSGASSPVELRRRRRMPWHRLAAWIRGEDEAPRVAQAVRVEPKTFFANERTLLQWMNTAVLLSTIGITLLNFGTPTGRIAGLLMAPVAVFFLCYSFIMYLRRSYCLERKEPINYNDRLGPSILVLCLVGALSATILLNVLSGDEIGYIQTPPVAPLEPQGHDIHIQLPSHPHVMPNSSGPKIVLQPPTYTHAPVQQPSRPQQQQQQPSLHPPTVYQPTVAVAVPEPFVPVAMTAAPVAPLPPTPIGPVVEPPTTAPVVLTDQRVGTTAAVAQQQQTKPQRLQESDEEAKNQQQQQAAAADGAPAAAGAPVAAAVAVTPSSVPGETNGEDDAAAAAAAPTGMPAGDFLKLRRVAQ